MAEQVERKLTDWVLPPSREAVEVNILSEDARSVFTDFGVFDKPDLTWMVDPRYKLIRSARHD